MVIDMYVFWARGHSKKNFAEVDTDQNKQSKKIRKPKLLHTRSTYQYDRVHDSRVP